MSGQVTTQYGPPNPSYDKYMGYRKGDMWVGMGMVLTRLCG